MARKIRRSKPAKAKREKEWEKPLPFAERRRRNRESEQRYQEEQKRKRERQSLADPHKLVADCEKWRKRIHTERDKVGYAYLLADALWHLWDMVWPAMELAGGVASRDRRLWRTAGNERYAHATGMIHNGEYVLDLLSPDALLEHLESLSSGVVSRHDRTRQNRKGTLRSR